MLIFFTINPFFKDFIFFNINILLAIGVFFAISITILLPLGIIVTLDKDLKNYRLLIGLRVLILIAN